MNKETARRTIERHHEQLAATQFLLDQIAPFGWSVTMRQSTVPGASVLYHVMAHTSQSEPMQQASRSSLLAAVGAIVSPKE